MTEEENTPEYIQKLYDARIINIGQCLGLERLDDLMDGLLSEDLIIKFLELRRLYYEQNKN